MDKLPETTEKKCPKCKSEDIQYLEASSSDFGSWEDKSTNLSHLGKCSRCGQEFHYRTKHP